MRNIIIVSIFLSFFIIINQEAIAQNRGGRKGPRNSKVVVVKKGHPRKFQRKKVVVIRKRPGKTIASLPAGYTTHVYRKNNYYFHNGYYYRNHNNAYHIIKAPVGIRIKVLPVGYRKIVMYGKPHFFYNGTYYQQVGNEYETVEPEVGTVVPEIPEEIAEQVELEGISYFEIADYLYETVETAEGVQYKVVGELEDETSEE
jgi:hypothetical protein